MARAMSPQDNASLSQGRNTYRSPSPAPQPQSKRDKRRTQIADKLNHMRESFEGSQTDHYYAQLSAIQCDINLVMRADPYKDGPLDDSPDEVAKLVAETRQEVCRNRPIAPEAENSFQNLAGKFYSGFVEQVNGALEERDTELTLAYIHYRDGMDELRRTNQYKIQLAHEEHRLLSKTLKDRLIQSVTQKKARLLKDKEQLDIADSNALLLNPTQFSIGNPASPGGAANPRKTRHTRLRPGEADDAATVSAQEGNKRKRKGQYDENDNGSPGPAGRNADTAFSAPARDVRAKLSHTQFEAPLYSLERLFSEKELIMNMNRAHVATTDYFDRLRAQGVESKLLGALSNGTGTTNTNGTPANNTNGDNADATDPNDNADSGGNADGNSQQPMYQHATRSTQRTNPLADLAATATALPPFAINISASASKANPAAPPPPGASDIEVQGDMLLMRRGEQDAHYQRLVQSCCEKVGPGLGWGIGVWKAGGGAADVDIGGVGALGNAQESSAGASATAGNATSSAMARQNSTFGINTGAVPMSKTSSLGGLSELGGSGGGGGAAMRRTASSRGQGF